MGGKRAPVRPVLKESGEMLNVIEKFVHSKEIATFCRGGFF
jgi:hypothetical protein